MAERLGESEVRDRWEGLLKASPMSGRCWQHKATGARAYLAGVCLREHDLEPCVLYFHGGPLWCRPLAEFLERFEEV